MEKTMTPEELERRMKQELSITCYARPENERNIRSLINQFKEDVAREWYTKGFDEMVFRTNFKGGWRTFEDYYNDKI